MTKAHTLKSCLMGNCHGQFGSGGGAGDCPTDHDYYRGAGSFVALDDTIIIIAKNGETRQITDKVSGISVSPDGKWMILVDNGLALYNEKNEYVRQISEQGNLFVATWRPDSQGLFLQSGNCCIMRIYRMAQSC